MTPAGLRSDRVVIISVYDIPDCNRSWIKASPDAHNSYVREIDQSLSNKVKPLVRFIKAWKYYRDVPVSSFYLELRVAKYASGESSILYAIDVERVFRELQEDLTGQDSRSHGCIGVRVAVQYGGTVEKREIQTGDRGVTRRRRRRAAEKSGKIKDAFYWWNLLFDGKFPSYYR